MKVPWPAAFEDGDVRMFLEEFEDVAELAGIRTDRGKLTALRALLKGRARAVLDAARRGPEKMEWAAAKDALIAGFDTPADRQEALRRFKTAQLGPEPGRKLKRMENGGGYSRIQTWTTGVARELPAGESSMHLTESDGEMLNERHGQPSIPAPTGGTASARVRQQQF
ncbi:unnamed protein product [Echinostoma caproni]|uniref:Retrotrans_gag domain-containing protein n=2 Tax=Echinostoma caproni TaxID=27848 RepID=A0A183AWY8_9TREM|nr:unnamed protein product [Echinostoma caproni]